MTAPCTLARHTCASCGLQWTGPVGELCRCSVAEPVTTLGTFVPMEHNPLTFATTRLSMACSSCAELRAALAAMVRRVRATGGYSTPEQQAEYWDAVRLLEGNP